MLQLCRYNGIPSILGSEEKGLSRTDSATANVPVKQGAQGSRVGTLMIAMTIQMRCFDERLLDAGNAGYVG